MTNNSDSNNENLNLLERFYNHDWSSTSFGPIDSWEPQIKSILDLCFKSGFPAFIHMGQDWISIYNEATIPVLHSMHPHAFLKPAIEIFNSDLVTQLNRVRESGKGIYFHDRYMEIFRDCYKEEVYHDCSITPIYKSDSTVWGVLCITFDTTQRVLNKRRLKTLEKLSCQTSDAESLESACQIMMKALQNNQDIPYALIYLVENNNKNSKTGFNSLVARLIAATFDEVCKEEFINNEKLKRHIPDYFPNTHEIIDLAKISDQDYDTYIDVKYATSTYSFLRCDCWPINLVIKEEKPIQNIDPWNVNRKRKKRRAKILADLNHQKDMFFQSISHELKTPLTLIFSPLDELINICSQDTQIKSYLQIIQRNTCRLHKLINTLLQYSNIESGLLEAHFYETDVAKLTREFAMNFENITRKLGLEYIIDVPNSDEFNRIENAKVYLDHDMYETIVFNLCSNAIKHTWNGSICVRLYLDHKNEQKMIVLEVSDTGVGIPKTTLPNIFQRFYRVESQNSRSHEGAGIGLTIIKEFVKCHGGDITVTFVVNKGTTFKCWFPTGCKHLPINHICYKNEKNDQISNNQKYSKKQLYLKENLQWIQNYSSSIPDNIINKELINNCKTDIDKSNNDISSFSTDSTDNSSNIISKKYQILVIEDNTDMRNYLSDLLKEFNVICACDGQDAIQILNKLEKLPDLILSDIMMPNMNGYELLDTIRSNIKTQLIPIILLTAKAGEESRIKELISHIQNYIKLSKIYHKILYQQHRQEKIKQLLFTISEMIGSEHDLIEALSNIINTLVALYENQENIIPLDKLFQDINLYPQSKHSQTLLNNSSGIEILLNTYCTDTCKNVSMLSVGIKMHDSYWGWIKLHRPSNSIWLNSEIELLQQISNQISLAIFYKTLIEENLDKEIQIKAETIATKTKTQILANTSHELRTPLGAIIGLISCFDFSTLTDDQKDMINIIQYTSDFVLSIVNEILNTAKLEVHQITSINTTFNLLDLFEKVIKQFIKDAKNKQIELILNYDIENLPKYIKSNPERINFTKEGKIIVHVSIKSQKVINNKESSTYSQIVKKECLLIELYNTSNRYQKSLWPDHLICKNLVTINGGEFITESQLEKENKFWFTWNINSLY
ncbi:hypothetical protein C2G38_2202576 [Gigaspora rosea]|uniref:Histidine kinase-like ATPase n=1 Tax=Gigaspora rosea TaxID=44941 RepID=A0A397UQZ5_9GLOM|nr:hypothetical protein C2G38_2202576 [Gigaspora rosea]